MKRKGTLGGLFIAAFVILCGFAIFLPSQVRAAEPQEQPAPRTGWRLGGLLPTITFDSDLGFQYGALVNLFYFGDGSRFPRYDHSLYIEISRFTRGSGNHRFFYDSDQLVRGIRTTFDLTYITDPLMSFHGFNGSESNFHLGLIDRELNDPQFPYRSRAFYAHDRKMFRSKLDLQGALWGENLSWVSGFELYNFRIGSVNEAKLNEKLDPEDQLPDVPGLFDLYKQWGLIEPGEAEGGWINYLKAGVSYDTRDNEPNPMRGMWTEAVLVFAPNFMVTGDYGHAKIAITHRQYFTLIEDDLSFAYRIGIQQTVAGRAPFYIQPLVVTSFLRSINSEGLGGSRTLRGIRRNRVVGDGFAMGNFELRWKFARFNVGATNVYLGLNGFFDAGMVTDPIEIDFARVPDMYENLHFNRDEERVHMAAGAGLRIAINENFIVAADFGRAFDKRDGGSGLYIGLNYLF